MRRRGSAADRQQGGRRSRRGCLGIIGLAVVLFVIGAIAGGGGDDDDPESTSTTVAQVAPTEAPDPTDEPTEEPEPTAEPTEEASRCEPVDDVLFRAISDGLTISGGGGSLRNAQAVKSDDYEEVWFVAADLQGKNLEGSDDIGIWATNSLAAGEGLIFAVDEVAQEFSDWGDGGQTDAQLSINDDGAQEARGCAEAAGE